MSWDEVKWKIHGVSFLKKVLILEDNLTMNDYLQKIVAEIDIKQHVFAFSDIKDAYQCALEKRIDLFVIDIILDTSVPGDSSGLKFVDRIRKIENYKFTPVIFVTSLEDAKLYTYERLHCYSFIEKPFEPQRLKELVRECLYFSNDIEIRKTLYFRKDGIILAVDREDIVYAESINHIMNIHTKQGDILKIPYITLRRLVEEADSADFMQCSRNTIVNKSYIANVDIPNQIIQLKGGLGKVEIGIMYKKQLKEMFR